MAHKTKIGGTAYNIIGGKTKISGTVYTIKGGKAKIGGTVYNIKFGGNLISFTIFDEYTKEEIIYQAEEGMTWAEWIESEYNTDGWQVINGDVFDSSSIYWLGSANEVIEEGSAYSPVPYL